MASGRLAAIAFLLVVPVLAGQTTRQGTLRIQVQDQTGARIPGARIEVRSEAKQSVLHTQVDKSGKAVLSLDPAIYSVKVMAPGFAGWLQNAVKLEPGNDQMIKVELKVAMYSGPVVVVDDLIEFEYRVPDASIAFEPLQLLETPSRKLLLRHHMHV